MNTVVALPHHPLAHVIGGPALPVLRCCLCGLEPALCRCGDEPRQFKCMACHFRVMVGGVSLMELLEADVKKTLS